ncbi:hypothetical protein K2173_016925 [Erythroxylum novogranatense]|uniref:Uncharacterized protein n=1 Tax=Erythroxylum novogranatense TaxID=1862640 RepID=A0AAV8U8R8_9ROSI|nr:hypothetical protein K2173_016925 [Erythroxylum novogranatense]
MDVSRQSNSTVPLVSRLDHVDFMMKCLEGKQNMQKWSNNNGVRITERPCMPLDLAVRETYLKGSLMDRVTSLERRLFQLCLEMEASSTSGTSSQTSGYASSSQGSKSEPSSSFPTFNYQNNQNQANKLQAHVVLSKKPQVQSEQEKNDSEVVKQKPGKNKNVKTCKSRKKRAANRWPHLRILGC